MSEDERAFEIAELAWAAVALVFVATIWQTISPSGIPAIAWALAVVQAVTAVVSIIAVRGYVESRMYVHFFRREMRQAFLLTRHVSD